MTDAGVPTRRVASERRHVTVVFSDLSGYTAMSESLDPEEVQEITGEIFAGIGGIVDRFGGRMDRLLGDSILAVFGDPVAHEDDAERAVRAALEFHRFVGALGPDIEAKAGQPLQLHTGVNTGVVVTGGRVLEVSTGPLGDTVNLASRLQSLAGPNEILVGPTTAELIAGVFDLENAGTHSVKGKTEPVRVARAIGVSATRRAPSRRHGRFVGRHEELGLLLGAVERMRDGEGSVFTIIGDAGAGKTRLLAELQDRAGDEVVWLEGRAYAHGNRIPYAPVIDLIRRVAAIGEDAAPGEIRDRLVQAIDAVTPAHREEVLGPLLRLFAIETPDDAEIDREAFHTRLLRATLVVIETLARQAPTVVCFQDLHWADPSTMTLVRQMIADIGAPLLVICNTRPGDNLDRLHREIHLSELSSRQTHDLIASLLDDTDPPGSLTALVESRADGNPFFVEEIVNSLIDRSVLVRSNGSWTISSTLDEASVPSTIRGVIAARIDQLDDVRKRVLREAAVVGRDFLYRVVNEVSECGPELATSLVDLQDADLIRERASDPDLEYFFKHALTQEVAYDGLLKNERQQLHGRVASAIESQMPQRSRELAEVLAHHWQAAGQIEQAVSYLRLAGNKAIDRYALDEADQFFNEAYELLANKTRTPDEDLALAQTLIDWQLVFYYRGDLAPARRLLELHEADIERTGDPEIIGLSLAWRGNAEWIDSRLRKGMHFLDRAIEIGERADNAKVLAHAIAWKLWVLYLSARPHEAVELYQRVPGLIARLDDSFYVEMKSLSALGYAYTSMGEYAKALDVARDLEGLSSRTGSTRAAAMCHGIRSFAASCCFDFEHAVDEGHRGVAAATDPIFRATVRAPLYGSLAGLNDSKAFREEIDAAREEKAMNFSVITEMADAMCQILEGKPSRGLRALEAVRARAESEDVDFVTGVADVYTAMMYARIATREVPADLAVALRNPGFLLRHAMLARRKAHAAFEAFEARFLETGRINFRFNVDFERAKLFVSQGDTEEAIRRLRRALDSTAEYGPSPGRTQAEELLARLT
jgi:class 3 adenylate cyclase/tetratricopeptide (TPR) repeat protein